MADIFNRLMASRFADATRRLYGEDLELSAFAPEIQGSINLSDPRDEDALATGIHLTEGFAIVPAVAANRAFAGVRNPPGSGVLVAVKLVLGPAGGATDRYDVFQVSSGIASGGESSAFGTFERDSRGRFQGGQPIVVTIGSELNPSSAGPLFRWEIEAAHSSELPPVWILAPDSSVRIYKLTVNTGFEFSMYGYWRFIRPEEKAFT